jgi:hypothetical protein
MAARIPDVDAVRGTPRSNRAISSDRSGEIVAGAFEDMGATLFRAGVHQQDRIDREEAQADQLQLARARQALTLESLAFEDETADDRDADTLEERHSTRLFKTRDRAAALLKDPLTRQAFEIEAETEIALGNARQRQRAGKIRTDNGRADLDEILAGARTAALETDEATASGLIANVDRALRGAVDSGFITAEDRTNRRQAWVRDYALARLETLTPSERIKAIEDRENSAARFLDADVRARVLRDAQAEVATNLTEQRQAMGDRLRDIGAAAAAGLPIGSVPSEAELKTLFGEHEGAQRHAAVVSARQVSIAVSAMHSMSTDELLKQVASSAPQQVEGAAEQAQTNAFIAGRTQAILAERERDPAGYLAQYSPAVRDEWALLQSDPSADPADYLRALRAERERLQLPGTDVVPAAYATQIADSVNSATAENLATTFDTLAEQWGPAWLDLYGQIAKDVPGTALVIGSGIPRAAATALASTAKLTETQLRGMLPPSTTWNDLESSVNETFASFQASMPADAARTTLAVKDAAARLALKYMNEGAGRGDAVQKAYRDLVESQYSLLEMRGATIRVPVGIEPDHVERAARGRLATFGDDALELQRAVVVPDGTALTAEEYQGRYREYVRDHGYWVTNPASTGVRLYLDGGPVAGPIEMTWDELQAPAVVETAARRVRQQRASTASTDPAELGLRQ